MVHHLLHFLLPRVPQQVFGGLHVPQLLLRGRGWDPRDSPLPRALQAGKDVLGLHNFYHTNFHRNTVLTTLLAKLPLFVLDQTISN